MNSELEDVARRLRLNEDGYSTLHLQMNPGYEARDVNILAEAVEVNSKLEAVEFFGILGDEDVNLAVSRLFSAFGSLPKLRSLQFSGYCEGLIYALSRLLREAVNLEYLSISYAQLDGGEYSDLNNSLLLHPKLKGFHILECQFPDFRREANHLNDLVLTLSRVPTIKEIMLSPIERSALGIISHEALIQLIGSPNLVKLHVYGFPIPEESDHMRMLIEALRANENIIDLRIASSLSEDNCAALAKLIESRTRLQSLTLDMFFLPRNRDDERHILKVSEALQRNTCIRELSVFCTDHCFNDDTLEEFGGLLEHNFTVRQVSFACLGIYLTTPTIDMFVKLNRLNRGELIQSQESRRMDWVDKLLEVNDDISCLFWLLSLNPALCSPDTS